MAAAELVPPWKGATPYAFAEAALIDGERYVATVRFSPSIPPERAIAAAVAAVEHFGYTVEESGIAWEDPVYG